MVKINVVSAFWICVSWYPGFSLLLWSPNCGPAQFPCSGNREQPCKIQELQWAGANSKRSSSKETQAEARCLVLAQRHPLLSRVSCCDFKSCIFKQSFSAHVSSEKGEGPGEVVVPGRMDSSLCFFCQQMRRELYYTLEEERSASRQIVSSVGSLLTSIHFTLPSLLWFGLTNFAFFPNPKRSGKKRNKIILKVKQGSRDSSSARLAKVSI